MSVQMSQVLPLAEDKAANSELKLAFWPKLTAVLKAGVRLEGECSIKVQGEVCKVFLCGGTGVCLCVCVSLVYLTDWNCWQSPELTN